MRRLGPWGVAAAALLVSSACTSSFAKDNPQLCDANKGQAVKDAVAGGLTPQAAADKVGTDLRCLSDDEATYAVVAREVLAGQVLYRDVVDHKPPGIYAVNAATQALGGPVGGMVLLHLLLIVVVWGTGLATIRAPVPEEAG